MIKFICSYPFTDTAHLIFQDYFYRMIRIFLAMPLMFTINVVFGQLMEDSVRQLNAVTVKGYAYDRASSEVPATIGLVKEHDLNRFSNVSFLPIVNTIPGVRMEERSPGSYRFAIRGSSLQIGRAHV